LSWPSLINVRSLADAFLVDIGDLVNTVLFDNRFTAGRDSLGGRDGEYSSEKRVGFEHRLFLRRIQSIAPLVFS
jgi:hypothetical protein